MSSLKSFQDPRTSKHIFFDHANFPSVEEPRLIRHQEVRVLDSK